MMNTDFPYLCFLSILQKGRQRLVDDVLKGNPDLYSALYKDSHSRAYNDYIDFYELKWINAHWQEILDVLEQKSISIADKKKILSLFSSWYSSFIKQWNFSAFDANFLDERVAILKNLIVQNTNWETNLKRMRVSIAKSEKILNDKMKEI